MDGRGGCCIAQYAGGAYDMSKVDRIMLRFRPIAPKPAICNSDSGGGSKPQRNDVFVRTGRTKRRYARDTNINNNNNNNNKRSNKKRRVFSKEKNVVFDETVVTLPLLPETPERKDPPASVSLSDHNLTVASTTTNIQIRVPPIWLSFKKSDRTVGMPQPVWPVGSCVTVEGVTDTCADGEGLGSTDEERRSNLERDTCPGFISDGLNRVKWMNEAYSRMVGPHGRPEMVWLVMKEMMPVTFPAFACRVRLQYMCGKEKNSLTVPCDVWRMDCGGFAWRLDFKAALSLGR